MFSLSVGGESISQTFVQISSAPYEESFSIDLNCSFFLDLMKGFASECGLQFRSNLLCVTFIVIFVPCRVMI